MAIEFSAGFRISSIVLPMRALLSAAGQTSYDAASTGNFFSCSLADYNAVFNGYTDAQKIGNTDAIFSSSVNSPYTATCASILPQVNSTISSNTYILGFACRMFNNSNYTVTPLLSTTYRGTYSAISNSPVMVGNAAASFYFLRKDPPITSTTSYVGHVASTGNFDQATTNYPNSGFDCAAPYSTWSTRNVTMPHFQMFTTVTRPY